MKPTSDVCQHFQKLSTLKKSSASRQSSRMMSSHPRGWLAAWLHPHRRPSHRGSGGGVARARQPVLRSHPRRALWAPAGGCGEPPVRSSELSVWKRILTSTARQAWLASSVMPCASTSCEKAVEPSVSHASLLAPTTASDGVVVVAAQ